LGSSEITYPDLTMKTGDHTLIPLRCDCDYNMKNRRIVFSHDLDRDAKNIGSHGHYLVILL